MYNRYTYEKYSFKYLKNKLIEQELEGIIHNTYPGVFHSDVSYDKFNDTLLTPQGSVLQSNGLLSINLRNFKDSKYCRYIIDGLGLFVYFNEPKKCHYSDYIFGYHTVQNIYNLYTNQTFQGYIGKPNSHYNKIFICENDMIHRHYDGHATLIKEPYFTIDNSSKQDLYKEYHYLPSHNSYELIFEWRNVWHHVPLWEKGASQSYLRNALRIIALYLATLRLEYKRDLFIGICHKSTLSKGRVLLFSYLGKKLSSLKVPLEIIKLVKNTLHEFDGYTSNAYFTWFYLPIVPPIEYAKVFDKASKNYNTLPGVLFN